MSNSHHFNSATSSWSMLGPSEVVTEVIQDELTELKVMQFRICWAGQYGAKTRRSVKFKYELFQDSVKTRLIVKQWHGL